MASSLFSLPAAFYGAIELIRGGASKSAEESRLQEQANFEQLLKTLETDGAEVKDQSLLPQTEVPWQSFEVGGTAVLSEWNQPVKEYFQTTRPVIALRSE